MSSSRIACVTGANKGIGFAISKSLAAHGFTVLVGSRDKQRGEAAAQSIGKGATSLQLDVTSSDSIKQAVEHIESRYGHLDVLVNNAAIAATNTDLQFDEIVESQKATKHPIEEMKTIWETNVFGAAAVTQAMVPLLKESSAGRIVFLGSGAGSLTWAADPNEPMNHSTNGLGYSCSKAAMNAVMLSFANELESTKIKVNSVSPGFIATDMNQNHKGGKTPEQGAEWPVKMALIGEDGPTGKFLGSSGQTIPW